MPGLAFADFCGQSTATFATTRAMAQKTPWIRSEIWPGPVWDGFGAGTLLLSKMGILQAPDQARNKRAQRLTVWVRRPPQWWGGGLPREVVVAEKFVLSLESLSSLGFEERNLGCPENFAGMSQTPGIVQRVC